MEALIQEAKAHRAINHPYLLALKNGEFKNMDAVLKDFALQYGAYSSWFPRYLNGVISKLENPQHREHLLDNLAEESGQLHKEDIEAIAQMGIKEEWVQGITHPALFRRFQEAIGADMQAEIGEEVQIWRDAFLNLIENSSCSSAIGAIGLGTESVVKYIYRHLIEAIEKHTDLTLFDYVFFPLHTEVDDEHGLILLSIAEELSSQSETATVDLRNGMLHALNIRASFWDSMMERALKLDAQLSASNTSFAVNQAG